LIGFLEIFGWCPGDIFLMSWRYLVGVQEILDWCLGDIWLVSWRYLVVSVRFLFL